MVESVNFMPPLHTRKKERPVKLCGPNSRFRRFEEAINGMPLPGNESWFLGIPYIYLTYLLHGAESFLRT
jgi:hypothetical protein